MWTKDRSELISSTIHPLLPVDTGILLGAVRLRTREKQVWLSAVFIWYRACCICDVWHSTQQMERQQPHRAEHTEHWLLGDSAKNQTKKPQPNNPAVHSIHTSNSSVWNHRMDSLESELRLMDWRITLRISMVWLAQELPDPHVRLRKEASDTDSKDLGTMGTGRTC